jgi:hypothetical protein
MSQNQPTPPPPQQHYEACLVRLRSPDQKGGTIIAEDVIDHATHERRICDPKGYCPPFCPRCGEDWWNVHDYRERVLCAELGKPVTTTVRLLCVACDAVWQILPLFVARHLWRTWEVVRRVLMPDPTSDRKEPSWPKVPERTARRWKQRWSRPALALTQILAASGPWAALAVRLPVDATCAQLVATFAAEQVGQPLAALAALIYRLQPKVRFM